MKIEQIYTGCLAQGAYYIESNGEAAIIDPLREVDGYIQKAEKNGVKIKYILETHFHADFVSGHVTLSEKTGALIIYGPTASPSFDAYIAKDNEELIIGDITIKVLHTPGHTLESTTYLLRDQTGKDVAIFTGDTLFLGDVGRPDLAQKLDGITQDDLAGMLFESLRNKILPLSDDITVYPAHGAGSACGKNMMKETVDSLGNQKKMNYALRADMTKQEFIDEVTDGLLPPPPYFPTNVRLNREGYDSLDNVLKNGLHALTPNEFENLVNEANALMLDVRSAKAYCLAHIPNSIFIGLDGSFAPWVGELIVDVLQPIVLIVDEGREKEALTRLARVGFDGTLGYLQGGIESWIAAKKDTDTLKSISASELEDNMKSETCKIIDVRRPSEFQIERIINATSAPLSSLNDHIKEFDKERHNYLHCAGGYRSVITASILKARGIHNIINIAGGFDAIKNTKIKLTGFQCPSTN